MIRLATVFSGIGAPEYALKTNFKAKHPKIVFACDCGELTSPLSVEERDYLHSIKDQKTRQDEVKKIYLRHRKKHFVKESYLLNNPEIKENEWYDDISFIDGKSYKNKVDLFIGGSPCQSFSLMGKRRGLDDARGTLFYDFARLVSEIQPKVFIYENVPGMLIHDKGVTWTVIKNIFDNLNYTYDFKIINSRFYGVPQNRRRLFVVGFKDEKCGNLFKFPNGKPLEKTAKDFLDEKVEAKYYLKQKGFEFVTNPKYRARAKINEDVIRTEKRNQQFNWNGDFRFETPEMISNLKEVQNYAYLGKFNDQFGYVRKMTPRECFRFMGFKDDFAICENDVQAYRQAGNSIVVPVISALIEEIIKTGAL